MGSEQTQHATVRRNTTNFLYGHQKLLGKHAAEIEASSTLPPMFSVVLIPASILSYPFYLLMVTETRDISQNAVVSVW
jgi:hypothetical protein